MAQKKLQYSTSTPLMEIHPTKVLVVPTDVGTVERYRKVMSKAISKPGIGRKLGFLVVQDEYLLGLIYLATPVSRLTVRDQYLFPNAEKGFKYGDALREYMDLSVCVAAQPIGWHWNLGKLVAMLAPTLGDFFKQHYGDTLKGITTTSLWGENKLSQYTRIYKHLGETKGFGHAHISDERYADMQKYLRVRCPHCSETRIDDYLVPEPTNTQKFDKAHPSEWCVMPGTKWRPKSDPRGGAGDGSNAKMRRIAKYLSVTGEKIDGKKLTLNHGQIRGVYYHPAVPPEQRQAVIQEWYGRWGLPRYERTKLLPSPYQNGQDGGKAKQEQV